MATDFRNLVTSLKISAMDAAWVEEKHHRSDNGRFTSGSGRGKTGGSEENGGGRGGKGDGERGENEEMSQDAAEKIVRAAFEKCGGRIDKMDLVEHHLSVKTNFSDLKALNKELGEHGLKAKQEGDNTLHIAEDAAEDYDSDPFFKLLVCLMQIGFYAKDLHYGATGKSFYGIHELADIAWKFSGMFDDINEIRYMGELGTIPPSRQLVAFEAAKGMEKPNDGETGALTTRQLIERVLGAVENAEEAVVEAKGLGCAAGTNAILDEVSKDCLKVSGLLFQSLKNDDQAQPVNADAIDRVIQKGIFIKPGETGQDSGTSEGAKKGWEHRMHGGGDREGQHDIPNMPVDFENIRSALSKFNYKTSFGNEVEFAEAPEARWNSMVIQGYKPSAGWGGGTNVSISNGLAGKMVDELKNKYRIDSWKLENGKIVISGDFSSQK